MGRNWVRRRQIWPELTSFMEKTSFLEKTGFLVNKLLKRNPVFSKKEVFSMKEVSSGQICLLRTQFRRISLFPSRNSALAKKLSSYPWFS